MSRTPSRALQTFVVKSLSSEFVSLLKHLQDVYVAQPAALATARSVMASVLRNCMVTVFGERLSLEGIAR